MNACITRMAAIFLVAGPIWTGVAQAHCDTLDGPVVSSARQALESGNLNPVLAWVRKQDEGEIRTAFQKTLAVRRVGDEAREIADRYFFETLVRMHRVGEGAAYTGLKPAGTTEPPVAAADEAIASGRVQPLGTLISDRTQHGLRRHFDQVMARKRYDPNDVEAGRAYSNAYVEFVHYADRLYEAAETMASHAAPAPAARHTH